MKILDSDHWIAILRGTLSVPPDVSSTEVLAITAISIGELVYVAERSARPARNILEIEILIAEHISLPYDTDAARIFGSIKRTLERQGERLDDADIQIASIALHHSVPLVTHNARHFNRIPGLQIEDWIA